MNAGTSAAEIVVVGAGIGGLTAALALAAHGIRARVVEAAPALEEVGAGLQISPNGMAVLARLGVAGALERRSVAARAVRLLEHRRSRQVARLDLARIPSPQPWLLVHRADLVAVLAAACADAGVPVDTGRRVEAVQDYAGGATLRLASGEDLSARLVVAADGLRSALRAQVVGAEPAPAFTGQAAWRALVPLDAAAAAAAEVRVWMGPGRHLVGYPLRGGRWMNLVAVEERAAWTDEGWRQRDDPARMAAAFEGFDAAPRALLARAEEVHLWGLFRRPVARRWRRGGLALLGDAAHPTLPFLAQGACMAIEDAWVLAACLAGDGDTQAALDRYEALRAARCRRIVAAADRNAWAYHLPEGPVRAAAHAALRAGDRLAPNAALRRFDWLYGFDVTQSQPRPDHSASEAQTGA